jgi:PhzF family phenazine biosynthesis protein
LGTLGNVARSFSFVQVDVFTDRVFGGNQLAVFFDLEPGALSDAEMQAIALEMNLAETTFVYPPTRADCVAHVRIFTPTRELPFAGHPTVGTTWVLANRGRLPAGQREVALEEGIGPVPVRIDGDLSSPTMVWMSHRAAEFGEALPNRAAFAAALHLAEADLLPDQPVRTGSTGIPFLFIPLRTPEAVDRAEPDMRPSRARLPANAWACSCSRPTQIAAQAASTRACLPATPSALPRTPRPARRVARWRRMSPNAAWSVRRAQARSSWSACRATRWVDQASSTCACN